MALTLGAAILVVVTIISLFGNILVLYLLTKPQRNLLKRPVYIFVYNICWVDTAVVVFAMSFKTVDEIMEDWVFGRVFCSIVEYTQRMLFRVNILMHVCIALDRYCSVVKALKPQMTRKQAKYIVTMTWFFSVLISIPLLFSFDLRIQDGHRICCLIHLPWLWVEKLHQVIDLAFFFILPLLVLLWLYGCIITCLEKRQRQPGEIGITRSTIRSSIRGVRVSMTVVIVFLICWIPVVVKGFNRLVNRNVNTNRTDSLYATAMYLAFTNNALIPLIYCGIDTNLQPAAKKLFCCFTKIQPEDTTSDDATITRNE